MKQNIKILSRFNVLISKDNGKTWERNLAQPLTDEVYGYARMGLFETLQMKYLCSWLTESANEGRGITQASFRTFVKEANLGIPADKVDGIFSAIVETQTMPDTPAQPPAVKDGAADADGDDDDEEAAPAPPADPSGREEEKTISYSECNNALRTYQSGGLWKDGVKDMIKLCFPSGAMKDMALHNVNDAFDKFDPDGSGTIGGTQISSLMLTLLQPGVSTDTFEDLLADSSMLGFSIPRPVIHELTDLVDTNHDGFLQAEEFINLLMAVVRDDVPDRVISRLGLTGMQMIKIVLQSLLMLFCLFSMITLVIQSFTSGTGIAQVVQTTTSSFSVMYVKSSDNKNAAAEEEKLIAWAKAKVIEELSVVLNLSSQAVQDMKQGNAGSAGDKKKTE